MYKEQQKNQLKHPNDPGIFGMISFCIWNNRYNITLHLSGIGIGPFFAIRSIYYWYHRDRQKSKI